MPLWAWMSALNTRILAPLNCIPPWKMPDASEKWWTGCGGNFWTAEDPNSRWEWMAYAANLAHYVLKMKRCPCCWRGNCTKTPPPVRHRAGRGKWKRFFWKIKTNTMRRQTCWLCNWKAAMYRPTRIYFLLNRLEDMLNDMVKRGEIKDEAGLRNLGNAWRTARAISATV